MLNPLSFISKLFKSSNDIELAKLKKILEKINLSSQDFTLCLELPAVVHANDFKYKEILSLERERYAGVTKVNAFFDGFKILIGMFKLRLKI